MTGSELLNVTINSAAQKQALLEHQELLEKDLWNIKKGMNTMTDEVKEVKNELAGFKAEVRADLFDIKSTFDKLLILGIVAAAAVEQAAAGEQVAAGEQAAADRLRQKNPMKDNFNGE